MQFMQEAEDFAADVAHPWLDTEGNTGTYYVPDARNAFRVEDAVWGWNDAPKYVTGQYGSATFEAKRFGLKDKILDDDYKNWLQGPDDLRNRTITDLTQKMLVVREARVEAAIDAATFGTTSVAGTGQWGSTAANPRLNVQAAKTAIRLKIGRPGNSIIIPGGVWDVVIGTQSSGTAGAAILDAIKYTGQGGIQELTPVLVARYFNVKIVKPALAIQSDATKHTTRTVSVGLPEAGTYVWDQKEVYVFYNDPNPGQKSMNFGISFGPTRLEIKPGRNEEIEADTFRIKQVVDEKIVMNAAMNVLTTVIA
jgi:hypothetical protein